jgi:glutamyl/glutaminyl-tRNA synthetase
MNKEYLAKLSSGAFLEYITEPFQTVYGGTPHYSQTLLEKIAPLVRERIHTKAELRNEIEAGEYAFFFEAPEPNLELLKWKKDDSVAQALPRLLKAVELLSEADFSNAESIKQSLWDYAESVGRGELLWPLRVSLTGRERSPDPFICAFILGKEESLTRIEKACAKIGG